MRDRKGNPVHRGNRLIDPWGNFWVIMLPAEGNKAHLMEVKTGHKLQGEVGRFLRAPKDWRQRKDEDWRKWHLRQMGVA